MEVLARWPKSQPIMLLHSGREDSKWARFSLLAEPTHAVRCVLDEQDQPRCESISIQGKTSPLGHDPFEEIERMSDESDAIWLGYLGYDLGRCVERLPRLAQEDRGWPAMQMQRCQGWAVYDHAQGQWSAGGTWVVDEPRLEEGALVHAHDFAAENLVRDVDSQSYQRAVERAIEWIAAGDIFQVNLAHRLSTQWTGEPRVLSMRLAELSPAWYAAYLEMLSGSQDAQRGTIVSASPELFLELNAAGQVITRPIKGTRPTTQTSARKELADSEKDAAELAMIVDLMRNDLGRVCEFGSVRVVQARELERHPTVHHATATITGKLRNGLGPAELLRATLPGGSITGAPKVRAMELIDTSEPTRRGPYTGCIGVIHGQTLSLNIAIRTALLQEAYPISNPRQGLLDLHVGAGIVADSQPNLEDEETMVKARAMLRALERNPQSSAIDESSSESVF